MPCANWPTLMQLENALLSNQSEHIEILRHQLDWTSEKVSELKLSSAPVEPTYDRIRIMIEKFGPKCLHCADFEGNTLVHQAAIESTNEKAVQLIIKIVGNTIDDQSIFFTKGKSGYTVFESAATNPCNKPLKYLVKVFGTRVVTENETEAVHLSALYQGADSMEFFKDEIGASCFHKQFRANKRNVFHYAAMNTRSQDALTWLIKDIGNAPLKVKDVHGNTPVHLAALMQSDTSMQLIYHKLGSEMIDMKGQDGETIIHCAARNEITNTALLWCTEMLTLENFQIKDKSDRMPIHLVAMLQDEAALKMVVDAIGEDSLFDLGENEMSVVHYAAMNTKTQSTLRWIVEELGSDSLIHQRDSAGRMAIHLAALHQGLESLKFIVQSVGPSIYDLVCDRRRNIAHYAAKNVNKEELLRFISIKAAFVLKLPDKNGHTPAKLASI